MELQRLTGPEAGVVKYDILTALSVAGLNGTPTLQTSLMRLIALVTARYNWRADEVTVGQRDMARMWSVNERTVKREIKRLTEGRWLICKRGGVRGRVGAYRLNHAQIAQMSEPCWQLVGPDFEARMQARYVAPQGVKVVQMQAYAEKRAEATPPQGSTSPGTWERAMTQLKAENVDQYGAWFARLEFKTCERGVLQIKAPSRFVERYIETHLMRPFVYAVEQELGPIKQVVFEA